MIKFTSILLAALLTGCALCPEQQPKYVALPTVPKVTVPKRPTLYIYRLKKEPNATSGQTVQYYVATVQQLLTYSSQLEVIVDEYQNTAKELELVKKYQDTLKNAKKDK